MKKTLLLLCFFTFALTQAQNGIIQGKIIDKNTNESVPFANIIALESTQGVISNEDGVFKFYIPSNAKIIEISSIGYKSEQFKVSAIDSTFQTIYLNVDEIALEEVIVTNKPINQILAGLVDNSKMQLDKSIKLETYYREFVKINDKYSKFADGLIDFYLKPKRKTKIDAQLIVKQSRAFQLANIDEIEKKGEADLSALDSFFDIQDAANSFFSYNLVEKIASKANAEKYDFELRSTKDENGTALEIIYINPKENISEALIGGKIIYNPIEKVILEIDLKMSEKHKKHVEIMNLLLFKVAFHDMQVKQTYKYVNGKYIPNYKKTLLDIYVKFGKTMNDRMTSISDLVVTNYDDTVTEMPAKDKIFKERSLYENGKNYTENFWETKNVMSLSKNEEQIINSLKN